jgi:hypothetical protein
MSKNTGAVDIFLLKMRVTWSVSLIHCSDVLWCARKPNWLALNRLLSSMCFWIILRKTFLNDLPVVERRLIGRKFWGNFGSLPGFGNVMIFASFQDFGKWDSRRQWLNKCAKCTNGRLLSHLRHSFGMPSIPQDFLNFKKHFSQKFFIASHSYRQGPRRGHRFQVTPLLCDTELLPSNGRVCRAIPYQRLCLLASHFLPWTNMPHYILFCKLWWLIV